MADRHGGLCLQWAKRALLQWAWLAWFKNVTDQEEGWAACVVLSHFLRAPAIPWILYLSFRLQWGGRILCQFCLILKVSSIQKVGEMDYCVAKEVVYGDSCISEVCVYCSTCLKARGWSLLFPCTCTWDLQIGHKLPGFPTQHLARWADPPARTQCFRTLSPERG